MICFTVQFFELEIYISITTEMEEIGQAVASFFQWLSCIEYPSAISTTAPVYKNPRETSRGYGSKICSCCYLLFV